MVVDDGTLDRVEVLSELPPLSAADLLRIIQEKVGRSSKKIVVLDDDPTGTQTVYDTPVLTEWSISSLTRIFNEPAALFIF